MQHGAVERGGGRRGDVHRVHGPVHVGLLYTGPPGTATALGERLLLRALRVVPLRGACRRERAGSASRHCSS